MSRIEYGSISGFKERTKSDHFSLFGMTWLLGIFGTAIPMTGIVLSLQYLSSGLASILITISPAIRQERGIQSEQGALIYGIGAQAQQSTVRG